MTVDATPWTPPERGSCRCPEHIEDILDVVIPTRLRDPAQMTVRELLATGDLKADPLPPDNQWFGVSDPDTPGAVHWDLWVGDAARACYADDAPLALDDSIRQRAGVERIEWLDREELIVGAPDLCAGGMLAALARALEDPRVR